jgi:hypothetical protein
LLLGLIQSQRQRLLMPPSLSAFSAGTRCRGIDGWSVLDDGDTVIPEPPGAQR